MKDEDWAYYVLVLCTLDVFFFLFFFVFSPSLNCLWSEMQLGQSNILLLGQELCLFKDAFK